MANFFNLVLSKFSRIFLGIIFVAFGLNGFLNFLPQPEVPLEALPFLTGLDSVGYFFPMLKALELLAGLLLLVDRKVVLALLILAPIVPNIFVFHYWMAPPGIALATAIIVFYLVLLLHNFEHLRRVMRVMDE